MSLGPMQQRDPLSAVFWLRRVKSCHDQIDAAKSRGKATALRNLGAGCLASIAAFWMTAVIIGAIAAVCEMNPRSGLVSSLVTLPSLAFGAIVLPLMAANRAARQRNQLPVLESKLRDEAEAFASAYPEILADLFKTKDELLLREPVVHALAFLERRGAIPPLGLPPAEFSRPGPLRSHPCAGQIVGGCRFVRKLGAGGMGAVYLAHHIGLDIPVAVKILPPETAKEQNAQDRFLREARAAAKLKHPNIVGVYNVGYEAGIHFIVMEFVEGGSLGEFLRKTGRMPSPQALAIIRQVCEGLQFAHDNGVIHRDIKPDNILISPAGEARIADLGLARREVEDLGLTQSGVTMGTPYYLSPEQARDAKSVDHRSDIYSLGCMSYEMLCGKVPYEGKTLARILLAHAQAPVPDPRSANPAVSDRVAVVVMRMMAKRPEDRYPSARAVALDLGNEGR